jgi:hypothetical protein
MIYAHEEQQLRKSYPVHMVNTDIDWKECGEEVEADRTVAWGYLKQRGLDPDLAAQNGWKPIWRKGLRILIPATTRLPGHHYWQARSLGNHPLRYESPNGPRKDALIVVKNDRPRVACVVEGPMDALAMAELPRTAGIALMGIVPPKDALEHLANLTSTFSMVYCLCDSDQIHGMMGIQNYLATRGIFSVIKVPQGGKDVADMTREERGKLIDCDR